MAFRVALVGLGFVGSSIGAALKQARTNLEIIGHDKDGEAARLAYKRGCVDSTEWNLINACEGADLIVISIPLVDIKKTLAAIGQSLKKDCIVTDTAGLKMPVLNWAREFLPNTVHFVGGHPIIARAVPEVTTPSAELFVGAIYCLTPSTDTPSEAIQTVSNMVEAIRAKPYYLDAAEHDSLIAAVEQLPLLIALALQAVASKSPSNREMVQLSGSEFNSITRLLSIGAERLATLCALNAANVTRWLDIFVSELSDLREFVANQERESLQQSFAGALEKHAGRAGEQIKGEVSDHRALNVLHAMLGGAFKSHKLKSG